MVDEFPPNSRASQLPSMRIEKPEPVQPKEKAEKVITGKVVKRKKPLGRRVRDLFLVDDSTTVGQYLLVEVLVPAVKAAVADMFAQGAQRFLYGDSRPMAPRTGIRPGGQYTPYHQRYSAPSSAPSRPQQADPRLNVSRRGRAIHDFQELVLESKADADYILAELERRVIKYGSASVADLYHFAGITEEFVDHDWGWQDLSSAKIVRTSQGWWISLPPTEELD